MSTVIWGGYKKWIIFVWGFHHQPDSGFTAPQYKKEVFLIAEIKI